MELMDVFQKYDVAIDAQCKRNERMYEEICKERGLPFKADEQLQITSSGGGRGRQEVK